MTLNFICEKKDTFRIQTEKHLQFEKIVAKEIADVVTPHLFDNNKNGCISVHYDDEFKVINYEFNGFGDVPQMLSLTNPILKKFRHPNNF
jgi:hypothetical protein